MRSGETAVGRGDRETVANELRRVPPRAALGFRLSDPAGVESKFTEYLSALLFEMAVEIERKFLVLNEAWRSAASLGRAYRQGYLATTSGVTVRVRREVDCATLTVKGPRSGITREEFSFPIGLADADDMLGRLCAGRVLEKVRYLVPHDGDLWSVDVYGGRSHGLVMAEIELRAEGQPLSLPSWVGREVSHDPSYRNSNIARLMGGQRPSRRLRQPLRLAAAPG